MRNVKRLTLLALLLGGVCYAAWDKTKPADDRDWDLVPGDIRANWAALEGVLGSDMSGADANFPRVENVKAYGAIGDGTEDDTTAIQAAEAKADDDGGIVYLSAGTYKITSSVTISSNVTLKFAPGAKISGITSTVQLIVNGPIEAGPHQIFDATYTEATRQVLLSSKTKEVCPEWWGAAGDGTTDDTTAVRQAFQVAAIYDVDSPKTVNISRGIYLITKPIFLGYFSSSGNSQSSFTWAGETRYWGGTVAGAKEGIVVEGRGGNWGELTSGLLADFEDPYPMIVIIGGRAHTFRGVTLDGADTASEGLFYAGGTWTSSLYDIMIEDCLRPMRLGNNVNWDEDPIEFNTYEEQAGIPTTVGGWMVEGIVGYNCFLSGKYCLSMETQQAVHTTFHMPWFYNDDADGHCVYFGAGRLVMFNPYFYGIHTGADIKSPASTVASGFGKLTIYGGHPEAQTNTEFIKEEYGYANVDAKTIHLYHTDAGTKSIDLTHRTNLFVTGGKINNVYYRGSETAGYESYLEFHQTEINGLVGNYRSAAAAANSRLSFYGCDFSKDSATTWMDTVSYTSSAKIVLEQCTFTGDSFTCDTSPNQIINGGLNLSNGTSSTQEQIAVVDITNANLKDLVGTPKELVAAPGAGKIVEIISVAIYLNYSGGALAEPSAPDDLAIEYDGGTGEQIVTWDSTGLITATADAFCLIRPTSIGASASAVTAAANVNKNVVLLNTGGDYTGAGSTSTARAIVRYRIHGGLGL